MNRDPRRNKFTLIQGGLQLHSEPEGPITRLGIRDRFPIIPTKTWAMVLVSKCLLLATMLYYFFG